MDFNEAFTSLFEVNMGVRHGERIVVFTDTIRRDEEVSPADESRRTRVFGIADEAAKFAAATYGNCRFVSFPATAASGAEPPEELWRAAFGDEVFKNLKNEGLLDRLRAKKALPEELERARALVTAPGAALADAVIGLSNNSTSHTHFRALLNAGRTRFASLPHFDPDMFFTSMKIDWIALAEKTARLAEAIRGADEIEVSTPNGTSIRFSIAGRPVLSDDGILTKPGSFSNLPAGEVFLAPVEGTAEGVLVLEFAPLRKLIEPLELIVSKGNVVDIRGVDPYREKLEQKFAESDLNRNIAELGIGTNDRATRPDNILEAEKILGTVHFALGDNMGFGGNVRTPFHEDYVFYSPTLTAFYPDRPARIIISDGKHLA